MAYTRLSETVTDSMIDRNQDGSIVSTEIVCSLWRCEECKLVWTRRHQAERCATRGHRNRYTDTYFRQYVIEGRPHIVEDSYERRAVRRDGPRPTPTPSPAQAPALSLADLKAAALAQGYRLSRIPVKAPVTPEPELNDFEAQFPEAA